MKFCSKGRGLSVVIKLEATASHASITNFLMGTWNNYLLFIYVFYYRAILEMALRHYELASTTVTGIPMKEEQNASSSANYDVELFHKASAHWRLLSDYHDREGEGSNKLKNEDLSAMMPQTQKEGFRYNTITLKWCTPRGSSADLHPCTALARVTPTDVNSRPSSCLTNFLLSGRSVMLEMPRRSGTKILSHMVKSVWKRMSLFKWPLYDHF